jgi:DtxR family transcriptional regulator, Mn-dependent transcriptional regulator
MERAAGSTRQRGGRLYPPRTRFRPKTTGKSRSCWTYRAEECRTTSRPTIASAVSRKWSRLWTSPPGLVSAPPSVTGMLKRLAEGGWVEYEPGRGARLTGKRDSRSPPGYPPPPPDGVVPHPGVGHGLERVDAEAENLEHAISLRLEQAIADYLGQPLEDPHGHPIPTREGDLARRDLRPLHSFPVGQGAVIREVQDDNPDRLRRWSALGLLPGATVKLLGRQDLDGTFEIEVGEKVVTLAAQGLAGLLATAMKA